MGPSHRFVATVNKEYNKFHHAVHAFKNNERKTSIRSITSISAMELLLKECKKKTISGLRLCEHEIYASRIRVSDEIYASCVGAKAGRIDLIERWGTWNSFTCQYAARWGHLHVLQWLYNEENCEWDECISLAAASGGHLEVLQWLRANGCPWNRDVCLAVAAYGHLKSLKW